MTYRGRIKNGVVVFKGKVPLKEGTIVSVEAVGEPDGGLPVGSAERILSSKARWHGDPGELDRLLGELREEKAVEMKAKREVWRRQAKKRRP